VDQSSEDRRRFWDEKHSGGVIEGNHLNPFFADEAGKLPATYALNRSPTTTCC
jgi:hypothetical protein